MSKKLSFLFVMFLLVILFFSYTAKTADLKEKVVIDGNYTTITLNQETEENQTWEYQIEDKDIIEVAEESYTKKIITDCINTVKGASSLYIKGISTGETIIKFVLIDNKKNKIIDTIKYSIKVKPNKIEVKNGNLIRINLIENRSTGFTWHLNIVDTDVVKIHHDRFLQPENEPGFVGESGTHYWYIQGLNQGKTELIFELYQDWNKEDIKKIKKYIIEVK